MDGGNAASQFEFGPGVVKKRPNLVTFWTVRHNDDGTEYDNAPGWRQLSTEFIVSRLRVVGLREWATLLHWWRVGRLRLASLPLS